MKGETALVIFAGCLVMTVVVFIVFAAISPIYDTLIFFGIVASIIIGAIIYVHRLPDAVPNDKLGEQ